MSVETVKKTAEWIKSLNLEGYQATVTFHGGEPLLAGADFYRQSLPILAEGLKDLNPSLPHFSICKTASLIDLINVLLLSIKGDNACRVLNTEISTW